MTDKLNPSNHSDQPDLPNQSDQTVQSDQPVQPENSPQQREMIWPWIISFGMVVFFYLAVARMSNVDYSNAPLFSPNQFDPAPYSDYPFDPHRPNSGFHNLSDTDFIFNICKILDKEFHDPDLLNYSELFNAALEGVAAELKRHNIDFKPEKIEADFSRKKIKEKFIVEFKRAKEAVKQLENLDKDALVFSAAEALLAAVDDSHTVFLPPIKFKLHKGKDSRVFFDGTGIVIRKLEDNFFYIHRVIPGSPAARAGLRKFDQLVAINRKKSFKNLEEVVEQLLGVRGTVVVFSIRRQGKLMSIWLKLDSLFIPTFVNQRLQEGQYSIDYLQIYNFGPNLLLEIEKYLYIVESADDKPDGIVVDVRNNPGGSILILGQVLEFFLSKEKTPLYILKSKELKSLTLFTPAIECPVVVLINEDSASGAELFSVVLQERNRAIIIGRKSAGVVSLSIPFKLSRKAKMHVTVAAIFTVSGKSLEKIGVKPDVVIDLKKEDIMQGKDTQLEKALEILKKQIDK